ncbi:MAG TPA: response regulator [Bryobacteraceae bacterium]
MSAITAGSGSTQNPDADRRSASFSPPDHAGVRRLRHILVADDSKSDVFLIREALRRSAIEAQIHVVDDGEKAIGFFEHADADPGAPCPDLVLLDINIPRYRGGDILRHLRGSSRCAGAPVLIVTSSNSPHDRKEMESLGANGYFCKPSEFSEFMKLGPIVREMLARNPNRQDPES